MNFEITETGSVLWDGVKIGFTAQGETEQLIPYIITYINGVRVQRQVKDIYGNPAYLGKNVFNVEIGLTYYVIRYNLATDDFTLMGEVNPVGKVQETNPDSPYISTKIGVRGKTLTGSDYDSINMDSLALVRAKWELYNRCRMQDTVTLTLVKPIYWMDVNKVINISVFNINFFILSPLIVCSF